jgi:hypothetical protein
LGNEGDFIKDLQNKTDKWKSGDISDVQVATFGSNTAFHITSLPMTPKSGALIGREP